jgi:hypothetical protein
MKLGFLWHSPRAIQLTQSAAMSLHVVFVASSITAIASPKIFAGGGAGLRERIPIDGGLLGTSGASSTFSSVLLSNDSIWQVEEQSSPLATLPSSHSSPAS